MGAYYREYGIYGMHLFQMEDSNYEPRPRPASTNVITSRIPRSEETSGPGSAKDLPDIQKPRKRKSPYEEIEKLAQELEGSESTQEVESPPLSTAAKYLMTFMKPKVLFPGRNLNAETKEELRSVLRKNAPLDTMTPQKVSSPASSCTKRSLLDCLPPSQESQESISQSNSQMSPILEQNLDLKSMDDAKTLLFFNEQVRKLSQESPKLGDQSCYKPETADTVCRDLGHGQRKGELSFMGGDLMRCHSNPGSSKKEHVQDMEVDYFPNEAHTSHHRAHMWKNIALNQPSGSVITQYRVDPDHKFPTRHSLDDIFLHNSNNSSAYLADISNLGEPEVTAPDLLDFIDKDPHYDHLYTRSDYKTHSSDVHQNNSDIYSTTSKPSTISYSSHDHMYYAPRSMKLKSGTPDSESGSPVWYIPVMKGARMQSKPPPSPEASPPKLYRHKLY